MSAVFNFLPRRRPRGPLYDEEPTAAPLNPALPSPRPVAPPVYADPITTERVQPESVVTPTPPLTTDDRRGRPRLIPGLSTEDQPTAEQQLLERLQTYEPRKRSILRQIGMGALRGFLTGGPGGAIGGGIFGAGTALLDPTAEDRAWKERQLERAAHRQQVQRQQQRGILEDDLLRAKVDETQAEAEQRRHPRPRLVEQVLPDGTTVLAPEQPGVITGRPKPEEPKYTVNVPGVGEIVAKPGEALGYYGQVERRGEERGIRENERLSNEERARISLSQAEQAERDNLEARKQISQQVSQLRSARAALRPDPAKVIAGKITDDDYWRQADALDAQIEEAQREATRRQGLADKAAEEKQKWAGEVGRFGARPPALTAPPPPPGVTEASVRAEARRRGANENEAVQRARDLKWIP